jgi:hypothetical protein
METPDLPYNILFSYTRFLNIYYTYTHTYVYVLLLLLLRIIDYLRMPRGRSVEIKIGGE